MTEFPFLGGHAALDLCNTTGADGDLLADPSALERWIDEAGLRTPRSAPCQEDLERVVRLRDELRTAFITHDPRRVAELTDSWLRGTTWHLAVDHERLEMTFRPDTLDYDCAIAPMLIDALDMVRTGIDRVRECASDRCSLIYLDASRNHSRRWCSMERCGSRAKAHAYYERHKRRA